MSELKFMVAPSGAGKTTWVNNFIKENKGWVAVSRDKLREQLFSYTEDTINEYYSLDSLNKREKIITKVLYNNIRFLLTEGFNVIIDNTNLKMDYINPILQEFPECNVTYEIINTTLEECVERNNGRKRKVDVNIIKKQYESFKGISKILQDKPSTLKKVEQDTFLQKAVVFDIDGTLSDSSHRHIFTNNHDEIYEDRVIEEVREIVNSVNASIIFVSGRGEEYRDITEKWLEHKVCRDNFALYMRAKDDFRKDTIVKEEIFAEITRTHHILFAVDDRLSVTRHLRKLGYFVINCNQSEKEF